MARTETVTVLFSDVVGSTELASRLGHDAYEVLRQEHFAAMLLDRNARGDHQRAAELITAALAETEQLDMPAEAAKLQRLRERLS